MAEVSALAPTGLNNPKALAPLHEENIQTKKKEYRAIPPAIFIVAIKIIPESVVQSLANSIHEVMKNGQDLAAAKSFAETLFSRLPRTDSRKIDLISYFSVFGG